MLRLDSAVRKHLAQLFDVGCENGVGRQTNAPRECREGGRSPHVVDEAGNDFPKDVLKHSNGQRQRLRSVMGRQRVNNAVNSRGRGPTHELIATPRARVT